MKITSIKTHLVSSGSRKNWLFVTIQTDKDITGWGECYTQLDRDRSIRVYVEELGRYLMGRDPFAIKHFTYMAYHDFAKKRGSMDFYSALSGIEQALWDIVGKAADLPVYNLLGGPCRSKIHVYANGWWQQEAPLSEQVEKAKHLVNIRGFNALKFDPFPNPWRSYITRDQEMTAIENIKALREELGPEIKLLIEVHRRLAPLHAIRVAEAIEEYNIFWYEEPVSVRNLKALLEVRRKTTLPIVTGEELYNKTDFLPIFESEAAQIINPDVANCGGLLELKEIAAMAEPYLIMVAPHNYNSTTIALAATLQVCATMPNFLIAEYFVNFEERGQEITDNPFQIENGGILLPSSPGLGLVLKEEALTSSSSTLFPVRELPYHYEENP